MEENQINKVDTSDFEKEISCEYKDEKYQVRDNGAILRLPKNGKARKYDNTWTFGNKDKKTGYMMFTSSIRVHQVVATAFHGEAQNKQLVVDHIDTNRCNNRPENLRWVTRLENAILNPITRNRIEFLCGSVEAFLKDPSILRNMSLEPNIEWMRTVTKEEAANTLERWKNLLETQQTAINKNNKIGEWIYQKPALSNTIANKPILPEYKPTPSTPKKTELTEEEKKELRRQKRLENKKKREERERKRNELLDKIESSFLSRGWSFKRDYKTSKWSADFYVTKDERKVAFSFAWEVTPELYKLMLEDGVDGCGFVDKDNEENYFYNEEESFCNPNFPLTEDGFVKLSSKTTVELNTFAIDFAEGRIIHKDYVRPKYIYINAWTDPCYSCRKPLTLYFVKAIELADGSINDNLYDIKEELHFNPIIVSLFNEYATTHPEANLHLGQIKERYSNTREESYMSFGCPHCDKIVGEHYYNDTVLELIYDDDLNNMIKIDCSNSDLEIKISHWERIIEN